MKKKYMIFGTALLLMVTMVFGAVPTEKYISDGESYFKDKVGMGTNTPKYDLEINNSLTAYNMVFDTYSNPQVFASSNSFSLRSFNFYIISQKISGGGFGDIAFNTYSNESTSPSMKIMRNTGYVGINDTTPQEHLDVGGNVRADSFIEYSNDYKGDALSLIKDMRTDNRGQSQKKGTDWVKVSHKNLPESIKKVYIEDGLCNSLNLPIDAECENTGLNESVVYGRNLNALVSVNTAGVDQLREWVSFLQIELCKKESSYGFC